MIIHVKGDVIEIKGSLVENHWLALKSAVSLLLKNHPSGVIIDGSQITKITEAGARTFLEASNFIETQHARVVISGLPKNIEEHIRSFPGARSQLPMASSIEEARASLAVGKAEALPESRRKPAIVAPLIGDWHRALEIAAVHANRKAEIQLLYIIEVPRDQPLGVPLPQEEHQARQTWAEAEQTLRKYGSASRQMTTRSRVAVDGVAKFASEFNPRLIIMAESKSEITKGRSGIVSRLCEDTPGDIGFFCTEDNDPRKSDKPKILVPIIGVWPRALEFAAEHAAARKGEIHLLYPILIPRTKLLDSPLPDEERNAEQILREAERIVKKSSLGVHKHTVKVRDFLEGVSKFASKEKPDLLIAAYLKRDLMEIGARSDAVGIFCDNTPCDVGIYCITE